MSLSRLLQSIRHRAPPGGSGPAVSRRALTLAAGSGLVAGALPTVATAAPAPLPLAGLGRPALDTLLRGVAALDQLGEAGVAGQAARMLDDIAAVLPEARPLAELYRRFPTGQSERGVWRRPVTVDMGLVEAALHEARPLLIRYRDLAGEETQREILPLALVYPDHAIFVLAWCQLRASYRQFLAHALLEVAPAAGSFKDRRLALIEGLAAHHRRRG